MWGEEKGKRKKGNRFTSDILKRKNENFLKFPYYEYFQRVFDTSMIIIIIKMSLRIIENYDDDDNNDKQW